MVYSFTLGLLVGLPLGCYIRERGYHSRVVRAYSELRAPKDDGKSRKANVVTGKKMDQFESTQKDYF